MRTCPYCGHSEALDNGCPACGRSPLTPRRNCPGCQRFTPKSEPVCMHCQRAFTSDLSWKIPLIIAMFLAAAVLSVLLQAL